MEKVGAQSVVADAEQHISPNRQALIEDLERMIDALILKRCQGFDPRKLFDAEGRPIMPVIIEFFSVFDVERLIDGIDVFRIKSQGDESSPVQQLASPRLLYDFSRSSKQGSTEVANEGHSVVQDSAADALIRAFNAYHAYNSALDTTTGQIFDYLYDDPGAVLEVRKVLDYYFDRRPPIPQKHVVDVCKNELQVSPNNADDLRAIVAIPVAAHQESGNIYRTLSHFARQTLDSSKYEIMLHLNVTTHNTDEERELSVATDFAATLTEIERFRQDNPDVVVRHFSSVYIGDAKPTIGRIRAELWDVVGYDLLERNLAHDVLVISADADVVHLNDTYLEHMVNAAIDPEAEIVAANLKWQKIEGLPYDSCANRMLRYQTFLDIVRNKSGQIHTADANTGIKLSAYFASGGYSRDAKLGEMQDIVSRIISLRSVRDKKGRAIKPVQKPVVLADGAWLRTHVRRLTHVMALGHSPYSAWDQSLVEFGTDDPLRTQKPEEQRAEEQAIMHQAAWIEQMTPPYTKNLDPKKRARLLKAAHRILGF